MTLSDIMTLAMRQLDVPPEDISEYDAVFRRYANMGYQIAVRQYARPRESFELETDGEGCADIGVLPAARIVEVKSAQGRPVRFCLCADGKTIRTGEKGAKVLLLCEVERAELTRDLDEPKLPEYAHAALADYVCYRHLSGGNPLKQSRAEAYRQSFYQQMQLLRPQGAGSVTGMRGLYEVTDARYRR